MSGGKLVEVARVSRRFRTADGDVLALDAVSFDLHHGEFLSIAGLLPPTSARSTPNDRARNCRMVRATTRAWLAAGKDPDGATEALHQLFPNTNKGAKDLTKQQWIDSFDLLRSRTTQGKPPGWMAREDMEALVKLLAEYGGMERPRPVGDYYTNDCFDCK